MEHIANLHGYSFYVMATQENEMLVIDMPPGSYEYRFFHIDTVFYKLQKSESYSLWEESQIKVPYGEWTVIHDNYMEEGNRILTLERTK